jgi:hypothetical protein
MYLDWIAVAVLHEGSDRNCVNTRTALLQHARCAWAPYHMRPGNRRGSRPTERSAGDTQIGRCAPYESRAAEFLPMAASHKRRLARAPMTTESATRGHGSRPHSSTPWFAAHATVWRRHQTRGGKQLDSTVIGPCPSSLPLNYLKLIVE